MSDGQIAAALVAAPFLIIAVIFAISEALTIALGGRQ